MVVAQVLNKTEAIEMSFPKALESGASSSLCTNISILTRTLTVGGNFRDLALRLGASVSSVVQERPLLVVGIGLTLFLSQPQMLIWVLHLVGFGAEGPVLGEVFSQG